jgi:hypothetical protein
MALDLVIPPQSIRIRRRRNPVTGPHPSALDRLYDISPGGMVLRRRLRRPRLLRLLLRGCLWRCLPSGLCALCGTSAADRPVPALWGRVRAGRGAGRGRRRPAAHVVDLHVPVGGVDLLVAEVRVRGDDVLRPLAVDAKEWQLVRGVPRRG